LKDDDVRIERFNEFATKPLAGAASNYLSTHRPRFVLSDKTRVEAPIEEVFRFLSKPQNLGVMTPRAMRFTILGELPHEFRPGLRIEYALHLGPVPLQWRTRIEEWKPPGLFADSQESGPYHCWWHEHHFQPDGNRTLMEDRVYYAPPLGFVGTVANLLFVAPALRRIFWYRRQALRLRFPDVRNWRGD